MRISSQRFILFALLAVPPAAAHDFWLEPSTFMPASGSRVGIRFRVGQNYMGDPVARDEKRIVRFVTLSGSLVKRVEGPDGGDPAGFAAIAGDSTVAYESSFANVSLPAAKFEEYLREEGLEKVIAERRNRGESGSAGREAFARCPKALLRVNGRGSAVYLKRAGLTFEAVPEKNPFSLAAGQPLPIRFYFRGRPAPAGILVVAINKASPSEKILQRTDRAGRVRLLLPRSGEWMVKAVEMVRTERREVEWQSYWASLTFVVSPWKGTSRT